MKLISGQEGTLYASAALNLAILIMEETEMCGGDRGSYFLFNPEIEDHRKWKLQQVEGWRWKVLSGLRCKYIDRHGNIWKTPRVGRIGTQGSIGGQGSRTTSVFELAEDEVIVEGDINVGGRQACGGDAILNIQLKSSKNRMWMYGSDETKSNPSFSWPQSTRTPYKMGSFVHYFRGRAGDNIFALGFGVCRDEELSLGLTEGRGYFVEWTHSKHVLFARSDRRAIEALYFGAVLGKGVFAQLFTKLPKHILFHIFSFY